jgi:hypothetical protein
MKVVNRRVMDVPDFAVTRTFAGFPPLVRTTKKSSGTRTLAGMGAAEATTNSGGI